MLRRCRPSLGTFVEITASDEDAIEASFEAIAQVHRLMSAHEVDSDLSRINRFAHLRAVEVHEWTTRVLERAIYWARQSDGAFDPVKAGRAALMHHAIPYHPEQPQPDATDWNSLELQGRSVRLMRPCCIDLGGIAKGFAVDRAIEALKEGGCEQGLVNAGGDLGGFGAQPWPVTIVNPLTRSAIAEVQIADCALATSAGLQIGDELSFDHLGGPHRCWTSVSVLATTACDADALTKLVWAGAERLDFVLQTNGAKAIGIRANGAVEPVGQAAGLAA